MRANGVTPHELAKAKRQLRARLVFEQDSITNIAHQLGYFETIASWRYFPAIGEQIDRVTLDQVGQAAATRLKASNRTTGLFEPLPPGAGGDAPVGEGAGAGPASRRRR